MMRPPIQQQQQPNNLQPVAMAPPTTFVAANRCQLEGHNFGCNGNDCLICLFCWPLLCCFPPGQHCTRCGMHQDHDVVMAVSHTPVAPSRWKLGLTAGQDARTTVLEVTPGGVASGCGVRVGDYLRSINGTVVLPGNLAAVVQQHQTTDKVEINVMRGDKLLTFLSVEIPCLAGTGCAARLRVSPHTNPPGGFTTCPRCRVKFRLPLELYGPVSGGGSNASAAAPPAAFPEEKDIETEGPPPAYAPGATVEMPVKSASAGEGLKLGASMDADTRQIQAVRPGGLAERLGVQVDDVIVSIQGTPVNSPQDIGAALANASASGSTTGLTASVMRGGERVQLREQGAEVHVDI